MDPYSSISCSSRVNYIFFIALIEDRGDNLRKSILRKRMKIKFSGKKQHDLESWLWKQLLQLLAYCVTLDKLVISIISISTLSEHNVNLWWGCCEIKWNRDWHIASIQNTSLIFHPFFYSSSEYGGKRPVDFRRKGFKSQFCWLLAGWSLTS